MQKVYILGKGKSILDKLQKATCIFGFLQFTFVAVNMLFWGYMAKNQNQTFFVNTLPKMPKNHHTYEKIKKSNIYTCKKYFIMLKYSGNKNN